MASNYTRRITIWINGKEVQNDIASIRNELTKLTNKQAHMNMDSSEYKQAAKEIQKVNNILAIHRNELKATASGWGRLKTAAEGMNRYFLMISSAVAGFGGALMAGKKAISMYAEFDDKVADVKRTTGMTRDEIYAMNEELKKVDTRTAQLDLMGLGVIAGKLGIAKQDVEGFVKAADKINVALSGALGTDTEAAINDIGKLVDIFKVKDKFGIEDSLLKVGSALNGLGNASTANEAYIVEFAKRVGGIAPMVNVSIQSVMGLAATLDMLGQTSEVSSTVYSAMITGMFKKTAEYANIAGLSLKDFKTLLEKDTNEAFIKVLDGLNGNNAGMERMVSLMGDLGMEGKRSVQVLGVLSANTKTLREQQEISNQVFDKGTLVTESFNSKNNSAQGVLEKARKNMNNLAVELGEKLLPALTVSTNGFSYFVKLMGIATDFVFKNKTAIVTSIVALTAYAVVVKAAAVWEGIKNIQIGKGLILTNLQAIATRVQILLTGEATMAQKRLLVAQNAANASAKANVWGLVAAAFILVGTAVYNYIKNLNKLSAAQQALKDASDQAVENTINETSKVDLLVRMINSENVSMAGKKKAIEDLQKIIPGYTAMLNAQGKVIFQNTQNVKDYINELRRQYMLQGYQEQFGKASLELAQSTEARDSYTMGLKNGKPQTMHQRVKLTGLDQDVADAQSKLTALQNKVESALNASSNTTAENIKSETAQVAELVIALRNVNLTVEQRAKLEKDLADHSAKRTALLNKGKTGNTVNTPAGNVGEIDDVTDAYKRLSEELDALDKKRKDYKAAGTVVPADTEKRYQELLARKKAIDQTDNGKAAAKTAEDSYKQQQDIQKKAIDASISAMEEGNQKELYQLHAAYAEKREATKHELELINKLPATKDVKIQDSREEQKKALNATLLSLDAGYVKDYNNLTAEQALKELKFQKSITDLKLESVKSGSTAEYMLKKRLLDQQMAIEIAEVTGTEEQKAQLIENIRLKYATKQAKEDEDYSLKFLDDKLKQDLTSLKDAEEKKLLALKLRRGSGQISQKEYNTQLIAIQKQFEQDSLLISIDKAQKELDILKAAGEDTIQAEAALAQLRLEAQSNNTAPEKGIKGNAKGFKDFSTEDSINYAVQAASTVADTIFQIERDNNQRILDDKISTLESQREKELSNKNLIEAQKDAINKKYDAKERKMKADAWQKQHKADIIQSIIKGALGVLTGLSQGGIPGAILAGVVAAAEIITVASQKQPEFYEGGFTNQSSDSRRPAGVVHDNEYVVPEEGLKNPRVRAIVNQIEIARVNKSLPTLNPMIDWKQSRQMFAGGFSTQASSATSAPVYVQQNTTEQKSAEEIQVMKDFTSIMKIAVENGLHTKLSLFDLEKMQDKKTTIQSATDM